VELITFSFFLSGLVHFILLISALRKDNYHIRLSALRFGMVKNILRASLPMGIGMIFVWIYDRADTLLIQNFLGNSAVAFYAVAYSLYKAPQAFSNFILTPVFTEFSGMFAAEGFIERNSFLKKLFILLTISIFFAFIISLSAKYIIMFFYHSTYYPSVGLLVVLLIALPGLILNIQSLSAPLLMCFSMLYY
jgi:O-antigen/teichoic acid export membrane protein